jgi:hypothetical protein
VFVVELNLVHLEPPAPLRLVPQTILERTARILFSDEEFYRFRVVNSTTAYGARRISDGFRTGREDRCG